MELASLEEAFCVLQLQYART